MDFIEASITINPYSEENAGIVTADLSEIGFESFCEEDPLLKAYIPLNRYSEQDLNTVLGGFPFSGFRVSFRTDLIRESDWNSEWGKEFNPVVVTAGENGCGCTVKSRHEGKPARTKYAIIIDPDMSFGTAHHQTTKMMLQYMLEDRHELKGKKLLDMGCGTGILSILAAKIHCAVPVEALDISTRAVFAARRNASINRVPKLVRTVRGDSTILEMGRYDVILANIPGKILIDDMSTYSMSLKRGGILYISGFLTDEVTALTEECGRNGFKVLSRKEDEDWAALKLEKLNFVPR
jgi:ribosomal protein L11 methyltransferase